MEPKKVALKIIVDGKEKEISFEELTLANNLAQEALVKLLLKKQIFQAPELLEELGRVRQERYKAPDAPPAEEKK
ncbi:MAG: hypothetical protein RBG1_1C00001G0127 [candidate division Zixibacteria bacterium RBG-1]|nr:MAG: hypothetical protein RBG1_1C00001G0127 [candidate division Zixibacteria bacterium RBG-1]OGC83418.1 MAG: hypothetical protein A2V73_06015 [candidate division Zixibacteria bacterium RBG_19FT_COMBO_42_43]